MTTAGEHMKIEYGRKVAFMNKQKKHGADSAAYEKAKAAVTHLHTRYIVDMQSMDSTVSEISNLRDDHLYPKLVSLVDGMARMWETMNIHHRNQMKIVADIRSLDVSQTLRETTEEQYVRTAQLQDVIEGWHLQFQMLATHLRKFIAALNSWLKLNLIPIESNLKEKVSSPPRVLHPPIQALIRAWNEHLEKLPVELAKNAISSFRAIILSIKEHQEDEGKLKLKCAQTRKELERKTRAFEDWYNKYAQNRIPPDGVDAEISGGAGSEDPVAKRQLEIEILKKTLEGELEAHQRHCKQVREKSLVSLKTHLPELFRALTDFSLASSEMYKRLQAVALSEKRGKRPS
ncbi:hypothetical protein Syun_025971 [Stephania yunnanensis]|uniref:DUF632 domain-containing protein n=1 Tax=Stephania yunnanensis TaxID=152371 RepID=A0AAP0HW95_9MAGN